MYKTSQIDIVINNSVYERILNNILTKAPVEIGVEVAVYMVLFGLLEGSDYIVADVNSMWRSKAYVYSDLDDKDKFGAVPDLVILHKDFKFGSNNNGDIKGANCFIEIKSLASKFKETDEIKSHRENMTNFIWTNGLEWFYFNSADLQKDWSIKIGVIEKSNGLIKIDGLKFNELLYRINSIDWSESK
jgi:hypothetical protein